MQFCGGYLDPVTKRKQNYIYEDGSEGSVSKGFLCPQYSKCVSNANPYNGRISFDNIVNSMELVFVIMSANTFTDLMYYTMDSDEMAACLFFIVCIFVLTIWLLNLLIAVLVSSFEIANEEYKKKKFIYGSRKTGYVARIVTGYWKYFKLKANQTKFPNWSQKGLAIYSHVEFIFVILIICDIGMRASVKVSTSANYNNILLKTDRGISIVLFIESLARLVLYLPNMWKFLTKPSYVYDFIISIITLVISCLAVEGVLGHMYAWLSIFHISRFYRVIISFKLTKKLWKQILSNGVMIWNLSSFYFFFTFLVAIIMAVYFEGVIPPEEMADQPFGMYSLPNSFLSLFIIGSTENWTDILYALQKHSPNISSAFFCSVFFIIWFLLSNSVILNIFIALISESMEVKEEEKRPQQIKHYLKFVYPQKIQEYTHASLVARIRKKFFGGHRNEDTRDFKQFLMRGTAIMNIAQNMGELADEFKEPPSENLFKKGLSKLTIGVPSLKRLRMFANNPFYKNSDVVFTETNDINGRTYILELNEYEDEKLDYLKKYPLFNYSYYFFSPQHRFRRFCQRLVPPSTGKRTDGSRFFEDSTDLYNKRSYFHHIERDVFVFIFALATILLIVCSCYVTPLYRMHHKMGTWNWSSALDCAFIGAFSIEFIVKTVADGFIYSPNAYLRNPWNFIDFCVLISMWINLIAYLKNNGNLSRIFKGLTALRALRCLTISNTARQTFNLVMFDGLNKIFEAGLISLSLLFPFTVWGLSIFKGRLGTCNDGSLGRADCYNEYSNSVFQWDIMSPRVYQQPYLHLDSFASAFNSLYQIISLEGWVDLLENMMNSSGIGTPATVMGSAGNALFLVLFNFLSMVFILNLFVSFIVNNQARTTGSAYFTIEEKAWLESQKLLSQAKPKAIPNLIGVIKS
ncbi:ASN_collapsed_G0022350.mRNA.1.CDS.1 [Saccharomyces cerevisiae]|nr:ASN_collapsed_G0022350.mRNA.1.CDS.1 [Saccharomyces cerevisiae]